MYTVRGNGWETVSGCNESEMVVQQIQPNVKYKSAILSDRTVLTERFSIRKLGRKSSWKGVLEEVESFDVSKSSQLNRKLPTKAIVREI